MNGVDLTADRQGSETLPRGVVICLVGALLLTVLGEWAAIQFRLSSVALATVVWYGLVFCIVAWYRFPLALLGLVVAIPLVTVEVGLGDVGKTLSTDKVALVAVTGVWLLRRIPAAWSYLFRTPSVRWWIAFLVVVLISGVRNGATISQGWGVLEQIVYAGVFLMALDVLGAGSVLLYRVVAATGLTGGSVALLALVEWAYGRALPLYFKHGTMLDPWVAGSTIGHVNFLGGYLVLLMPILLQVSVRGTRKLRTFGMVGAVLVGVALLYTGSIGAYIGLGAAGLLAVGLAMRESLQRIGRLGVILACAALLTFGASVAFSGLASVFTSVSARLVTYRIGIAAIAERPLLGFGANGYPEQYVRLARMTFGQDVQQVLGAGNPVSAHSSFLDVAVERGLLGLAAFVGLLASLLICGIRSYFRTQDSANRALLLGLIAGLVAFMVQAFTENLFSYSKVAAIFWILAAALVRLENPVKPNTV